MIVFRLIRSAYRYYKSMKDPVGFARSIGVKVGSDCRFIGTSASTFGSEPYLITIGDHVTLTTGIRFVTHDGGVWVFRREEPTLDVVAPITIGNNVFIGINCILMPGVEIGDNCVIGAGSIVTKSLPPGSIAAGSPAKAHSSLESYRLKSLKRGLYIRDLPADQKEKLLRERFRSINDG